LPLALVIAVCASVAVLALDAIYHLLTPVFGLEYTIVAFDLAAVVFLLLLHRRHPKIIDWVQWIAIIWGGFGLYSALTDEPLLTGNKVLDVIPYLECLLLGLFVVMKLPSSKRYLTSGSPPNPSLERP
jgi:TctA family transporter